MTSEPLVFSRSPYAAAKTHSITFAQGSVISLRRFDGSGRLKLGFRLQFRIEEQPATGSGDRWRAMTSAYDYQILDATGRELLAFHWQPGADFYGPDFPHLHIASRMNMSLTAAGPELIEMSRFHLPTGIVSAGSVVRLLLTEFQIAPRVEHWAEIVSEVEKRLPVG